VIPFYFTAHDNQARPQPGRAAGSFALSDRDFTLSKTAGGALLRLGYAIHLLPGVHVSLSGLTADVLFHGKPQVDLPLGLAGDPACHVIDTDHEFPIGVRQFIIQGHLRLPLTFDALEAIERFRDGGVPEIAVTMNATAFVKNKATGHYEACRLDFASPSPVRHALQRDAWLTQMRNAAQVGSVLVEIPLAVTRQPPWDRVWARLDAATADLGQGGESGNKNCVHEVRQALDAWRKIDGIEAGSKGGKEKDKRQRLHGVANALYHYCSLSAHADEHDTDWSRADAILALATLCGLLSARDP
jgi:hypothetical protein